MALKALLKYIIIKEKEGRKKKKNQRQRLFILLICEDAIKVSTNMLFNYDNPLS
jgi:hypothetical protein